MWRGGEMAYHPSLQRVPKALEHGAEHTRKREEQTVGVSPRLSSGQQLVPALQGSYPCLLFYWIQEVGGRPSHQGLPCTVCGEHTGSKDMQIRNTFHILPSADIHSIPTLTKAKEASTRALQPYCVPSWASDECCKSTHTQSGLKVTGPHDPNNMGQTWPKTWPRKRGRVPPDLEWDFSGSSWDRKPTSMASIWGMGGSTQETRTGGGTSICKQSCSLESALTWSCRAGADVWAACCHILSQVCLSRSCQLTCIHLVLCLLYRTAGYTFLAKLPSRPVEFKFLPEQL